MYVCIYVYIPILYIHSCLHMYIYIYVNSYLYSCTFMRQYIHTYIHTYIHAYIHADEAAGLVQCISFRYVINLLTMVMSDTVQSCCYTQLCLKSI